MKHIVKGPDLIVTYEETEITYSNGTKKMVGIPMTTCPLCGEDELYFYEDCVHCGSCEFFHMLKSKTSKKRFLDSYPEIYKVYVKERNKGHLVGHEEIYTDNLAKTFGQINEPSIEEIINMQEANAIIEGLAVEEEVNQHTRPLHFEAISIGEFEYNEAEKLITSYLNFEDEDIMFGINVKIETLKEETYAEFGTIEFYNKLEVEKLLKKYSYEDLQYFIKMMWNFEYSIEYV